MLIACPAFADSDTANTTVSLTVQNTSSSYGGGWNFWLKPGVFPVSDPLIIELWTQMYDARLQEEIPTDEEMVQQRNRLQNEPSILIDHPSAPTLRRKKISDDPQIFFNTEGQTKMQATEAQKNIESKNKYMVQKMIQNPSNREKAQYGPSRVERNTLDPIRFRFLSSLEKGRQSIETILKDPVRVWKTGMVLILVFLAAISLWIMLRAKIRKPWYMFNTFILLLVCSYGGLMLLEYVGAANTTVTFTVTNISLSCDGTVELGTISISGNTGAYSSTRKTTCTIETSNANGYTLQWKAEPISGGTGTGSLRSENGDMIAGYTPSVSGTPETWSMSVNDSEWGGRVSSTSTTMSSATWGTDGTSEKWMNVSATGQTIVTRNSATGGSPDVENIGFTAEIGSNKSQPAGRYQARIVFTAIEN